MTDPNFIAVKLKDTIGQRVLGSESAIRYLTSALLIGGHVLLEGPPGVAKTKLAKTFAQSTGLKFSRIQFTPDLMPGDVTGINIFDQSDQTFKLAPGPIFTEVLLADEINRTPPKTQSALLEAMQERKVTIDGKAHKLGDMFFVIATQNPIEHEGTYPLPEAQLDRFLFKIELSYPDTQNELRLMKSLSASMENIYGQENIYEVVNAEEISQARMKVRDVNIEDSVVQYGHNIVKATRNSSDVLLGASPRAGIYLILAAKVNALFEGRNFVIPDDIKEVSGNTLAHRLVLSPESFLGEAGPREVLEQIVKDVPVSA